jgi:hypothetical protein
MWDATDEPSLPTGRSYPGRNENRALHSMKIEALGTGPIYAISAARLRGPPTDRLATRDPELRTSDL